MSSVTGAPHLVRLVLRRDRVRLPVWLLGITAATGASANAVRGLYDTPEKIAGYAATVTSSPATRLMNGRPTAVDTLDGITVYESSTVAVLAVSLMSVFLVVRHTRAEEETGRSELLRSTVVGRHAATLAAVSVAVVASVLVGLLDAGVLVATGAPVQGSLLHGASLTCLGVLFAAVAAASAQVTPSARGALGIAGGLVGAAYVLRGLGDVSENVLTWVSPFGWAQGTRPFGDERWWLLTPLLALAALFLGLAVALTARRDAGAGLVAARPGRTRAARWLGTSWGLALRNQRGLLLGWMTGLTVTAALFGSTGQEVVDMVADNPELSAFFAEEGGAVLDGYFAFVLSFLAVVTSAFGVSSALRLRAEEEAGRAEVLLATGLSRGRWVLGSLAVTVVGTALILLCIGLGLGVTHALVSGDSDPLAVLAAGAVAQAPAVLAVVGCAVLVVGWLPRWTALAWAAFAFVLLQSYLGGLLDLPGAVAGLSPYWHLPSLPTEDFTVAPAATVAVIAAALHATGLIGLRVRDIA
ncbi:MAG TPA: hypothetical protein VER39_00485 [Nocardioidaceae bacterium]|nr:hypothetical protein [Nocardioidaceae bacterium]